jgi:phosphatidylglycerophosphate synthase
MISISQVTAACFVLSIKMEEPTRCGGGAIYSITNYAVRLLDCEVSPNQVTYTRVILLVYAYILAIDSTTRAGLPIALFIIALWLDDVDGCVARTCHLVSEYGANLDTFVDVAARLTFIVLLIWGYKEKRIRKEYVAIMVLPLLVMVLLALTAGPRGVLGMRRVLPDFAPLGSVIPSFAVGFASSWGQDICTFAFAALCVLFVLAFKGKMDISAPTSSTY